jgi:glycosyltransferase involved in cell wall biosynthesis
MKIAQVSHNYLPHIGGIELYIKRLIDSLTKKGIQAEVLTTNMSTPETGRKTEAKYFKTSFAFMRNPFSLAFIKHLKKNNYDILHIHSVWFLHCIIAVYFRKNARIIATIHGVYPDDASLKLKFFLSLYKPFVKYILKRSEKVFVYSAIEEKKLQKIFNVSSEKIVVLPMAINIEKYEDQSKEQVILFTGRIIPDKNPELLIKAAALLNLKFKDFKLVFVGSIEERYKQELIDLSKRLEVKNEIKFVGQLDPSVEQEKKELMRHYMTASVFVSLGSWEGQPTRLMEAMQFETPVIAFASGGTADFVADNKNGLVIDKLEEALLVEKLEKLLSDEDLATKLGEKARKTILQGYNWDNTFEKILAVYKK